MFVDEVDRVRRRMAGRYGVLRVMVAAVIATGSPAAAAALLTEAERAADDVAKMAAVLDDLLPDRASRCE